MSFYVFSHSRIYLWSMIDNDRCCTCANLIYIRVHRPSGRWLGLRRTWAVLATRSQSTAGEMERSRRIECSSVVSSFRRFSVLSLLWVLAILDAGQHLHWAWWPWCLHRRYVPGMRLVHLTAAYFFFVFFCRFDRLITFFCIFGVQPLLHGSPSIIPFRLNPTSETIVDLRIRN